MFPGDGFFLIKRSSYLYNIKVYKTSIMKKFTKLFAAFAGLVLFASACAQRTCPTYTQVDTQQDKTIEATA